MDLIFFKHPYLDICFTFLSLTLIFLKGGNHPPNGLSPIAPKNKTKWPPAST